MTTSRFKAVFDSIDDAQVVANDDEYIVGLEWLGRNVVYAVCKEPHRIEEPRLFVVAMNRAKK